MAQEHEYRVYRNLSRGGYSDSRAVRRPLYTYNTQSKKSNFKKYMLYAIVVCTVVALTILLLPNKKQVITSGVDQPDNKQQVSSQLNGTQLSKDVLIVNKRNPLLSDFVPSLASDGDISLSPDALSALTDLLKAAMMQGHKLKVVSSYRSYQSQKSLYDTYVKLEGQKQADTFSARPGYSEHQTGLAFDIARVDDWCTLDVCFGDTPTGQWVAENAATYGFIVRYEKGKETKTGYSYEPWHLRHVGIDLAKQIKASGQTLDEFTGVQAGDYSN